MLRRVLFALAVVTLVSGTALGHVPAFAGDNTSPGAAHEVDPPTKSWAIYGSLDAGQVRYYELHLDAGQRLELSLFTPDRSAFAPSLVVMGPAVDRNDSVPDRVTVPEGYGVRVVEGERPAEPSYEANAPSANYETAAYATTVETGGRYLVAVYEPDGRSGQVGVVAGDRESFTVVQYLTVAWDLPRIYLWEGAGLPTVFGPPLVALLAGGRLLRGRLRSLDARRLRTVLAASGLLVVGTSGTVLVRMLVALSRTGPTVAAVVTGLFVAVPALLGSMVVRLAVSESLDLTATGRALLTLAGLGSLATWAGYVVAPLAVLAVALWPTDPLE